MRPVSIKLELDKKVAQTLRMSRQSVSCVTFEFIEAIRAFLVSGGYISLPRFGRLRLDTSDVRRCRKLHRLHTGKKQKVRVERDIRVHFSKSPQLKLELMGALEENHGKARSR